MVHYANRSGDSGVTAYELLEDAIIVEFQGSSAYLYDSDKPGLEQVAEMQRLAVEGSGLNTYISKFVRKNYKSRIR